MSEHYQALWEFLRLQAVGATQRQCKFGHRDPARSSDARRLAIERAQPTHCWGVAYRTLHA